MKFNAHHFYWTLKIYINPLYIRLTLNDSKCEIITDSTTILPAAFSNFESVVTEKATLLGSPLSPSSATDVALSSRLDAFKLALSRLRLLYKHDALVILRHSFSLPSLLHILRSSYCGDNGLLAEFDEALRCGLADLLNVALGDEQWLQATLPVRDEGLGLRRTRQVASSAVLASANGLSDLITAILPIRCQQIVDPVMAMALNQWSSLVPGALPPSGPASGVQRLWDAPVIAVSKALLLSTAVDDTMARLLAIAAPHASDWLNAPPLTAVGLRMSDETKRVAVGLRLESALCAPHSCPCGSQMDARESHGLSCKKSAGRQMRHSRLNDVLWRSLGRAGVTSIKEPTGLVVGSALRPEGVSLIPWARGKCLASDATVPDTVAASHLQSTQSLAGSAANHSTTLKHQKWLALDQSHIFIPVAVETLGPWADEALAFVKEVGRVTDRCHW